MRNVLSIAELEAEHTELLPVRETLTFGFGNNNWAAVYATNSSLALNAASILAWPVPTAPLSRRSSSARADQPGVAPPRGATRTDRTRTGRRHPGKGVNRNVPTTSCERGRSRRRSGSAAPPSSDDVLHRLRQRQPCRWRQPRHRRQLRNDQLTGQRTGDAVPRLSEHAVIPIRRRLCCSGAAAVLSFDLQSTPER